MRLIELIAGGIGKVWSFLIALTTISLVCGVALFGLTVFMPDNVLRAIEIIKNLIS